MATISVSLVDGGVSYYSIDAEKAAGNGAQHRKRQLYDPELLDWIHAKESRYRQVAQAV